MIGEEQTVRSIMGLLEQTPIEDLKALLNNDEQLADMVADFKNGNGGPYGVHESERQLLLASNKSAAEYNLQMEPKLTEARRKLEESYMAASQIYKRIKEKEAKIENASGGTTIENAFDQLRIAVQMAEEESEGVADKFTHGQMSIDEFLEVFPEKRKEAHLKRVKAEKMPELIEKKRQELRTAPARPAPPPPVNGHPPYPMSSMPPYPTAARPPYPTPGSMPYPPYPMGQPFPRY